MKKLLITFLLLVIASPLFADDKRLYESIVRIRLQSNTTDTDHCGGSGTVVKLKRNKGLVLTAAHIVESLENINEDGFVYIERFKFRNKYLRLDDIHKARILSSNIKKDVAFLEFNFNNEKEEERPQMSAIAATFPTKSSDINYVTIGCPKLFFPNKTFAQINSVNCHSSVAGLDHNSWYSYGLGFEAEKGRSGSPLFDENGAVIGLLSYIERYKVTPQYNTSVYVAGPTIMEELTKLRDWHDEE